MIETITNIATTGLTVTSLSPETKYYFMVRVVEVDGHYVDSTQRSEVTAKSSLLQQPWFIGAIVAIVVVAALIAVLLKRRK